MTVVPEQEQRQHWAEQHRAWVMLMIAVIGQAIAMISAAGTIAFWLGALGERVAGVEIQLEQRSSQIERMAVVEVQIKSLYEGQLRIEKLLTDVLGRDDDGKRR